MAEQADFSAVMRMLAEGASSAEIGDGLRALPPDSVAAFRESVAELRRRRERRTRPAGAPDWLFGPREEWLLRLLDDARRAGLERALASASEPPPLGPWQELLQLALDVVLASSRKRIGELMAADSRLGTQELYETVAHVQRESDPAEAESVVLAIRARWLLWILQRGRLVGHAQALAEAPALPRAARLPGDEPDLFEDWNMPAGPVMDRLREYDRSGDLSALERLTADVREMAHGEAAVGEAAALQQTGARWLDRYERTPEPAVFATAVELLDGALARFPPAHIGAAHTRHMLAGAWMRRWRHEKRYARQITDLLARAAEELPADDRFWPECVTWLGGMLVLRFEAEGDQDVLAQAIEVLDRIRTEPRADSNTWLTAVNLRLHALRHELDAGLSPHLDDLLDTVSEAMEQVASDADLADRLTVIGQRCREIHQRVESGFLDAAVAASRTALRLSPPHQEGWWAAALELTAALVTVSHEEPDPAPLAEALALLDTALSESPRDWDARLGLVQARAGAATRMFDLTGEPRWAELGLRSGRAALALARHQGRHVSTCAMTVAQQLISTHWRTGGAAELDEAIDLLEEAASLVPREERSVVFNSLGAALARRFGARADIDDIDAAISALETAEQAARPGTAEMRDVLNNLSHALVQRYLRTRDRAFLDRAMGCLEEALRQSVAEADRTSFRARLAAVLLERFRATERPADLERCLELSEAVLGHRLHANTRLMAHMTYGNALLRRHRRGGPASDLDRAIEAFERTLPEARADAANGPRYLRDLALTYQDRYDLAGAGADLDRGTALYRECIRSATSLDPSTALDAARLFGEWAAGRGAWSEAADAYGSGLTAVERLVAIQSVRAHKESWLREAQMLPARAAYALVRSGRPEDAVLALEKGQALLLSEALGAAQGGVVEEIGSRVSFPEITRAARERPLVYLAVSPWGGVALLVDGAGTVRPIPLPELTYPALREQLLAYIEAYDGRAESPAKWRAAIDDVSRWLWTALMEPLVTLGHPALTMVPTGYLWLLPTHLAWRPDDGPAGRRYALDDVLLTYAPNARVLNREADLDAQSILMVEDPALPYARQEAKVALRRFADEEQRHLREATRSGVLAALGDHGCLHFACHGRANPYDPLESALLLSDARLTLRDVIATRTRARLVVLSACETAMTGIALPDEVVGLPAGFLQAGATGVLGSLWAVPDKSTARLMSYFYELWRDDGRPPADALREAQQRLRDEIVRSDGPHAAHPSGWGAFVYVGR